MRFHFEVAQPKPFEFRGLVKIMVDPGAVRRGTKRSPMQNGSLLQSGRRNGQNVWNIVGEIAAMGQQSIGELSLEQLINIRMYSRHAPQ